MPRLVGSSAALSRLGGGIGTRGPGETKLETDRRRIRHRISMLSKEIDAVRRRRAQLRERRHKAAVPTVALVGYTNAGKTTLFNLLTGDDAVASDALFVTLDPLVRKVKLPDRRELLVSDTVGFIDRLPHSLVAAFRATLEEVAAPTCCCTSSTPSQPDRERQMAAVRSVLARSRRRDGARRSRCSTSATGSTPGSAARLRALSSGRAVRLGADRRGPRRADRRDGDPARARHRARQLSFRIRTATDRRERVAQLYRVGRILRHVATDGQVSIEAEIPRRLARRGSSDVPEAATRMTRAPAPASCSSLVAAPAGLRAPKTAAGAAGRRGAAVSRTSSSRRRQLASARRRRSSGIRPAGTGCRRRPASRRAQLHRGAEASPAFYPAEAGLGYVALAQKKHKEALRALRSRRGRRTPLRAGARRPRRGAARARRTRRKRSQSFEAALAADPSLTGLRTGSEVLRFRGQQQDDRAAPGKPAEAGKFAEARAAYSTAIEASPQSPFLYRELAVVERRAGQLDSALDARPEGHRARARRAASHILLGEIYEAQGDFAKAVDAFSSAVALEPDEALSARIESLRSRAAFAAMPPEYRAIASRRR